MESYKLTEEENRRIFQGILTAIDNYNPRVTTEFEAFKKELADFFPKAEHGRLFQIVQNPKWSIFKLKEAFLISKKSGKEGVGYYFGILKRL